MTRSVVREHMVDDNSNQGVSARHATSGTYVWPVLESRPCDFSVVLYGIASNQTLFTPVAHMPSKAWGLVATELPLSGVPFADLYSLVVFEQA